MNEQNPEHGMLLTCSSYLINDFDEDFHVDATFGSHVICFVVGSFFSVQSSLEGENVFLS